MKKLVNIDIVDVDDEAYAARHSFSNKAPVTFIFFAIIDHQWSSMVPEKWSSPALYWWSCALRHRIISKTWRFRYKLMPQGTAHRIKRRWASFFCNHRSSMMINGSQKMKLTRALLEKLCLAESASFWTSSMMSFTGFFIFLFRHVHVRTAVGTACGTKKNKTKVCTFWNESEWKRTRCAQKLHYQIAHTKRLYIRTHYEDIFIFQPSKSNGRKRTCLYVFSFCPPNRIIVSIMYVYYIRTFRE